MLYKLKVTLTGIKGFYRIYTVSSECSLYSFHKQMRADMSFPADQLILFKALDTSDRVVARYGLFDLGNGAVDNISLAQAIKAGTDHFVYFYDATNRKSVNISIEGEVEGSGRLPVLVDTKGPDPIEFENGYVAFEDLPEEKRRLPGEDKPKNKLAELLGLDEEDDEDDDDEDDEDVDEDTEEVFDEDEDISL